MKRALLIFWVCIIVLFVISGCDLLTTEPTRTQTPVKKAIFASTIDFMYTAGNIGLYDIEKKETQQNLRSIDSDNNIKSYDNTLYIIERGKNSIIKLNKKTQTLEMQEHFGANANIHDIAFISSTKAYVTQHSQKEIAIYNPTTGKMTGKSISLEKYTPAGGTAPHMDAAIFHNGKVYIGLQKYTADFMGFLDSGSVIVINAANDSVEKEILLGRNAPQGMVAFNNVLFVACTGKYGVKDGAIVSINMSLGNLVETVVNEISLNGDVSSLIIVSGTKAYANVTDATYVNHLIEFNSTAKTVGNVIANTIDASDVVFDGTSLYVADRNKINPGIVVIDPATNTKVSGPHSVGLPPNKLAFIDIKD
jgi:DNA-binding beta-propeller fold protein YncE